MMMMMMMTTMTTMTMTIWCSNPACNSILQSLLLDSPACLLDFGRRFLAGLAVKKIHKNGGWEFIFTVYSSRFLLSWKIYPATWSHWPAFGQIGCTVNSPCQA